MRLLFLTQFGLLIYIFFLYLRMYQHGSLLFNIPQMYVMNAEGL